MGVTKIDKIRALVRGGRYTLSQHVIDHIADNEFGRDDIEVSILTGELVKSPRDEQGTAVDGRKHTVRGRTKCGLPFETVGKIIQGPDGNEYFVITGYEYR
jgi:hypothetical protein